MCCGVLCCNVVIRSDGPCSDLPLHRLPSRGASITSQDGEGEGEGGQSSRGGSVSSQDDKTSGEQHDPATHGGNIVHTDSEDGSHHNTIRIKRWVSCV